VADAGCLALRFLAPGDWRGPGAVLLFVGSARLVPLVRASRVDGAVRRRCGRGAQALAATCVQTRHGLDEDALIKYPDIKMHQPIQLEFPSHGGRRKGAGRPKSGRVSHDPRPAFSRTTPAHVTLRVREDVPSLRSSRRFVAIRRCFAKAKERRLFRLVKFAVLGNHLHLIVEADDSVSLSRGMQSLNTRLARALNKLLARRGTLFDDHYHSHLLRTPTEVARALAYVRDNARRHFGEIEVDYFSSAHAEWQDLLAAPAGWLLCVGWRLGGRRRSSPV
jgi:putative transposase